MKNVKFKLKPKKVYKGSSNLALYNYQTKVKVDERA